MINKIPPKGDMIAGYSMEIEEEENTNALLFSDTSYKVGTSCREWREMYDYLEVGDFSNEYQEGADHFVDIHSSYLHNIASRTIFMTYTGMVHWIICHVSSETCNILSDSNHVVVSFRPGALKAMNALPTLETNLEK